MDVVELHRRTADRFHACLKAVAPGQWDLPTPCTEWDVRSLVRHVTANHERMAALLTGRPVEPADDSPVTAWTAACSATQAALVLPDALDLRVRSPFGGEVTVADHALVLTTDLATHTWDLAHAIGADETLEPQVVADLLRVVEQIHPALTASGKFAPAIRVPDSAGAQERLLALLGRRM